MGIVDNLPGANLNSTSPLTTVTKPHSATKNRANILHFIFIFRLEIFNGSRSIDMSFKSNVECFLVPYVRLFIPSSAVGSIPSTTFIRNGFAACGFVNRIRYEIPIRMRAWEYHWITEYGMFDNSNSWLQADGIEDFEDLSRLHAQIKLLRSNQPNLHDTWHSITMLSKLRWNFEFFLFWKHSNLSNPEFREFVCMLPAVVLIVNLA